MRPFAESDGTDAPRLIHEGPPGIAAVIDDVIVALEDAVREVVGSKELPDILDGIELW